MSFYLKIAGGLLLLLGAYLISEEYSAYAKRRIEQNLGILALLSHAEGMIERYLAFGRELWEGFENEALEKCGFLSELKQGRAVGSAFSLCLDRFCLSEEAVKRLKELFSSLGRGYKEEEVRRIFEFRKSYAVLSEEEGAELEKSVGVVRAISIGAALVIFILII